MTEMQKNFVVIRHGKSEKIDKEPVYSVVLKSKGLENVIVTIAIKSTEANIQEQFPLKETIQVSFKNPQTRLG